MIKPLSVILLILMCIAVIITMRYWASLLRRTPGCLKSVTAMWWLLAIGTGVYFARKGTVQAVSGLDPSARMQLVLCAIGAVMAFLLFVRSNGANFMFRIPVLALLFYGMTGLLSTVYSPAPFLTLYKASLIILDVLAVAATIPLLRKARRPTLVFDVAIGIAIVFVSGAFLGVLIRPEDALRPLNAGGLFGFILDGAFPYMNGNELGFLSAVVSLVSLSRLFQAETKSPITFWVICGAMGLVGMIFAQARTAIAGFLVGVLILSIAVPRLRKMAVAAILVGAMVGSVHMVTHSSGKMGIADTVEKFLSKGQSDEGLQSFEGRMQTWKKSGSAMFLDSPLLGHGFDAGVRYGGRDFGIAGTHMHNSHVQILANTGLLGYLPWIVMVTWTFFKLRQSIKARRRRQEGQARVRFLEYEMYAVLIMLLLRTMTGSVMVNHGITLIFILGIITYLLSDMNEASEMASIKEEKAAHIGISVSRQERIMQT